MWLSKLAPLLLVAACGFSPALAPGGAARDLYGRVSVEAPKDENGFVLVAQLEQRLGIAAAPAFDLSTETTIDRVAVGVTPEQETTRFNLVGTVKYSLRDGTGALVSSGEASTFTSYSTTSTAVATATAERDAYRRLMVSLADQVVARLISDQARQPQ